MIYHPSEHVAGDSQSVIMEVNLILSYRMVCGRRERFEAVVIEFPSRVIRARPFQLGQWCIRVTCVLSIHARRRPISSFLTANENRREDVRSRVYEAAFPCYTDRSQRVVTCDHSACEVSGAQSLDGRCSPWLQLVFKDHQTEKAQS